MRRRRWRTDARGLATGILHLALVVVALPSAAAQVAPAAPQDIQQDAPRLTLGTPVSRPLTGSDLHHYQLPLRRGEFVRVDVAPRGIAVDLRLVDPGGRPVVQVQSSGDMGGAESLRFVAPATAAYRLEVRAADPTASPGHYDVRLGEQRVATRQDRDRFAGDDAYARAVQLAAQGTAESRRAAAAKFEASVPLFRSAGDSVSEVAALHNLASVYETQGEMRKALAAETTAVALVRALGDTASEAIILSSLGGIQRRLGEHAAALETFGWALELRRAVGEPAGVARTLNNLALVHDDLGADEEAVTLLTHALEMASGIPDSTAMANTLANLGKVQSDLGQYQQALDAYTRVRALQSAAGIPSGTPTTLNNIAMVYLELGQPRRGLTYLTEALRMYRKAGDRDGEATTQNNFAGIHSKLDETRTALTALAEALRIYQETENPAGQAKVRNNMGGMHEDLGEHPQALTHFKEALQLFRAVGDRSGEARALKNLGGAYDRAGRRREAHDAYATALPIARAVGDRFAEAATLYGMGRLARRSGDYAAAVTHVEHTLAIVDSLRNAIGHQALRASYISTVQDYYELHIAALMDWHAREPDVGHDARALQANEARRARSLVETLAEGRADIRQGVDSALVEREQGLQRRLNARAQQHAMLLSGPHQPEQASRLSAEITALTADLQQAETVIRRSSPRYAALTRPVPLDLRAVQRELEAGTILLEYALGDDASFVWAVTPTTLTSYRLPPRAAIEAAARRVHHLVSGESRIYPRHGPEATTPAGVQEREHLETVTQLSNLLLTPLTGQLGERRLVIVADGALDYVPFAALPDPDVLAGTGRAQPLILRHEVVSLPTLSVLATVRRESAGRRTAPGTLAVVADPVFSAADERVRPGGSGAAGAAGPGAASGPADERLLRLPGSRREAEGILALVPRRTTHQAFDFAANRALATSGELGRYRYVHLATHGLVNSLHPELSAIVLSLVDSAGRPQDGFLRAHEIYNLRLPADVVVLSACQTGLGPVVKGEGLIGITRGFLYAGAERVVVSLWSVSDDATAELMVRFYRGMLREGRRPADALRAAQVAMWQRDRWQAPHAWAGFVLQGEWH